MEKVELLNKQSKMSVDAYYAEKANNDKIIAEKNLNALQQKKEAILSIEWPEDKLEERDTKLEQINAEMAKQTRALELAAESITGLKDLKEIVRQDFARNNPQQSKSDVVREKTLSAIETELIKFATEHGWDNPGETIKQVLDASIQYGIDARELVALIQQESGGKRNAKSPAGAIGLTQLMPETAAEVGVNPYDWRENINGGAAYLAKMRGLFVGFDDILERAFAAYNAGAGAVQKYGGIPPYGETQAYVKAILAYLEQMSGVPDTRYLPKPSASSTYGFYATGDNMLRGSKFDSRYLDESHSVGGVTKLDGIQDIVYSIFNQVAKDYFDKTGERLVITGGSEDGHAGGEFSHGRGWKLDISVPQKDRELLAKLLDSAGIAAGNEGNHWDLSFGGGGIGGPSVNSRQTGNLHNTPTLQNFTAKSELQLEYLEKYRKLQDDSMQDRIKIAELYGSATEEKIAALDEKYLKQIAEIYTQFPNEIGEKRVAQLKVLWDNERRGIRFEGAEKQLKYTLKDLEASSEAMGDKIVNGAVSLKDGIDKYYDHFTGDNSSVKKYLDELETLMREYESQGNLEMYWKVRDEIESTKKSLTNMISSWLSKIDERFSFESNMVDADWTMTSGQKEREKQAIEQAKQRVKADAYAEQIKQTAIELKEWQEKLNGVIAELEKTTDDKAKYALEQEKTHIQGKISELSQLQVANQRAYELASALGHVKTLLEETRQTAKQALEDGLVEFLTDGIQQAESLGDALRNLAVSFLKTMNQFFTKKVVGGLMDAWFPEEGFGNKETDYTSGAETATLSTALETTTAATEQASMATEQSTTALEANTSATENLTSAMNNAPAQGAEGTATTTAGTASSAASTANSATASGGAVQQTGGGTATQAGAPSTSNFITNIFGSSLGQLAGSLFSLKTLISGDTKERLLSMIYLQLQLIHQAVTALSFSASSGFATGGYISGVGTATSDSIPAMLSNGEYVIKASAVRQYGRTMLDRINSGSYERLRVSVPKFATGGYVGSTGAKATNNFATSFGASVSPQLHVNNYVDGKRVFDSYGKEVVRSEVTKAIVQNAKLYSKTLGLF